MRRFTFATVCECFCPTEINNHTDWSDLVDKVEEYNFLRLRKLFLNHEGLTSASKS